MMQLTYIIKECTWSNTFTKFPTPLFTWMISDDLLKTKKKKTTEDTDRNKKNIPPEKWNDIRYLEIIEITRT